RTARAVVTHPTTDRHLRRPPPPTASSTPIPPPPPPGASSAVPPLPPPPAASSTTPPPAASSATPRSHTCGYEREVEGTGGAVGLRGEVAGVGRAQVHAGRYALGHRHSEPAELVDLVRVVGQQGDTVRAQGAEHLGGGGVVARVLAVTEGEG